VIKIEDQTYVYSDEIAAILEVSDRTIGKWVAENRIPSIKLGSKRIFNLSSINQWLKANIE